jgi:hypothetical protein
LRDGFVDGVGHFVGVGATDDDAVGPVEQELFDELGLFLRVLFVGRAPVDLDRDAVLFPKVASKKGLPADLATMPRV